LLAWTRLLRAADLASQHCANTLRGAGLPPPEWYEVLLTLEQWAERNGTQPVPADPAPRGKLKIQPHTAPAVIDEDEQADREEAFADDFEDDAGEDDADV
jgi:hypothetical protein